VEQDAQRISEGKMPEKTNAELEKYRKVIGLNPFAGAIFQVEAGETRT
jgi:hypothetical protein